MKPLQVDPVQRGPLSGDAPRSEAVAAFNTPIPTVSLEDLIALKQALGRPKDLRVAVELDELRRRPAGR